MDPKYATLKRGAALVARVVSALQEVESSSLNCEWQTEKHAENCAFKKFEDAGDAYMRRYVEFYWRRLTGERADVVCLRDLLPKVRFEEVEPNQGASSSSSAHPHDEWEGEQGNLPVAYGLLASSSAASGGADHSDARVLLSFRFVPDEEADNQDRGSRTAGSDERRVNGLAGELYSLEGSAEKGGPFLYSHANHLALSHIHKKFGGRSCKVLLKSLPRTFYNRLQGLHRNYVQYSASQAAGENGSTGATVFGRPRPTEAGPTSHHITSDSARVKFAENVGHWVAELAQWMLPISYVGVKLFRDRFREEEDRGPEGKKDPESPSLDEVPKQKEDVRLPVTFASRAERRLVEKKYCNVVEALVGALSIDDESEDEIESESSCSSSISALSARVSSSESSCSGGFVSPRIRSRSCGGSSGPSIEAVTPRESPIARLERARSKSKQVASSTGDARLRSYLNEQGKILGSTNTNEQESCEYGRDHVAAGVATPPDVDGEALTRQTKVKLLKRLCALAISVLALDPFVTGRMEKGPPGEGFTSIEKIWESRARSHCPVLAGCLRTLKTRHRALVREILGEVCEVCAELGRGSGIQGVGKMPALERVAALYGVQERVVDAGRSSSSSAAAPTPSTPSLRATVLEAFVLDENKSTQASGTTAEPKTPAPAPAARATAPAAGAGAGVFGSAVARGGSGRGTICSDCDPSGDGGYSKVADQTLWRRPWVKEVSPRIGEERLFPEFLIAPDGMHESDIRQHNVGALRHPAAEDQGTPPKKNSPRLFEPWLEAQLEKMGTNEAAQRREYCMEWEDFDLVGGSWRRDFCLLCNKFADDSHFASKAHKDRASHYLDYRLIVFVNRDLKKKEQLRIEEELYRDVLREPAVISPRPPGPVVVGVSTSSSSAASSSAKQTPRREQNPDPGPCTPRSTKASTAGSSKQKLSVSATIEHVENLVLATTPRSKKSPRAGTTNGAASTMSTPRIVPTPRQLPPSPPASPPAGCGSKKQKVAPHAAAVANERPGNSAATAAPPRPEAICTGFDGGIASCTSASASSSSSSSSVQPGVAVTPSSRSRASAPRTPSAPSPTPCFPPHASASLTPRTVRALVIEHVAGSYYCLLCKKPSSKAAAKWAGATDAELDAHCESEEHTRRSADFCQYSLEVSRDFYGIEKRRQDLRERYG